MLPLGMSICIRQSGSPWGLSRLAIRKRGFFPRGDRDEGKNSSAGTSGWGSGTKHP
ncbi:hypothetical protein A2U01_0085590, partial [Trifolium medium]|nr:hypothetical protein [Trifolium medium]